MKGKKTTLITISLLAILVLASLSIAGTNGRNKETVFTDFDISSSNLFTHQSVNFYYREHLDMWLHHEAWWDTNVAIEGVGITLGNLDFWELPDVYAEHLDWINLDSWDNKNPDSINTHMSIRFRELSVAEAEQAADLLIEVLEQFLIIDFCYDGYNGYDDWRGDDWVEITEIRYSAHVDWTNAIQTYENAIPREKGGIAETLNVTEAKNLRFEAWYDAGRTEFVGKIGFSFRPILDNISGSHSISLKQAFHIDGFQASNEADEPLRINVHLPDVNSLSVSPWYNDTELYMEQMYHPDTDEPWNKYNNWKLYVELSQGKYIDDFVLNFDYEFRPWDLMNQERAEYAIDPRGYDQKRIYYSGDYAHLSTTPFNEGLLTNVMRMHLSYSPLAYPVAGHTSIYFELYFNDLTDHATEAYTIAQEIESILGYTFSNNWSWDGQYWDHWDQTHKDGKGYGYSIENIPEADFNSLITNSLAYQHSSMLNTSNLLSEYTGFEWNIEKNSKYGYFGYDIGIQSEALDYYIETPNKTFTETASAQNYTVDILNTFGWTNLPYSSTTEKHHFWLNLPITNGTQITVSPDKPNGWGYNYWYHNDRYDEISYGYLGIDYYTDTPYHTDYEGTKLDPVSEWAVTFNYQFKADTEDFDSPNIQGLSFYDTNFWNYDLSIGQTGETIFGIDIDDDGHLRYWDTTTSSDKSRFPGSGISNVEGNLYYGNLPIDYEGLVNPLSFTYNTTADKYTTQVDLSSGEYADGEWELEVSALDNAGNIGTNYQTITVDNYDDATYVNPASISWTVNTPADGDSVSDNVTIEVEVTDDVGVFLVVLWVNFGGFILEDPDNDGIYSKELDTAYYFEGPMEVIIEAWDMEGHYSSVERSWTVDNIPSGNEPTVNIISPTNEETINGTYLVQAEVIDDIGIKSVTLQVDGRTPILMSYNETSGYYQYNYNTNQLADGWHTFTINVVDKDENTHYTSDSVEVYVSGSTGTGTGNAPEYNLINVPINQSKEELMTQINEVTDESKAVVGEFNWELEVMDDIGIEQVVLTLDDKEVYSMNGVDAGPNAWSTWTYTWNSNEVKDGAHVAVITITDIDENQHSLEIKIGFTTMNGNVGERETIGLDGFTFFWALLAIIPIGLVTQFMRRKKIS